MNLSCESVEMGECSFNSADSTVIFCYPTIALGVHRDPVSARDTVSYSQGLEDR
jgi:hypothetical protein